MVSATYRFPVYTLVVITLLGAMLILTGYRHSHSWSHSRDVHNTFQVSTQYGPMHGDTKRFTTTSVVSRGLPTTWRSTPLAISKSVNTSSTTQQSTSFNIAKRQFVPSMTSRDVSKISKFVQYKTLAPALSSNSNMDTVNSNTDASVTSSVTLHTVFDVSKGNDLRLRHSKQPFKDRIRHLNEMCNIHKDEISNITYKSTKRLKPTFLFSRKYNFSYCKVAKIASTFMTRVFSVLEEGAEKKEDAFYKARAYVHSQQVHYAIPFDSEVAKSARALIITRNPFSRLFSAFIDKIYIPGVPMVAQQVLQVSNIGKGNSLDIDPCAKFNVTFEQFLNFVLVFARYGYMFDRHWAPIVQQCAPCSTNVFALIQQESFADDLQSLLKDVNVATDEYDVIFDALHKQRVELNVPGMVMSLYNRAVATEEVRQCLGLDELNKRLWNSLQVQGFISERVPYPRDEYHLHSNDYDTGLLIELILEANRKHPLNSDERLAQRHQALIEAYRNVHINVITGVTQVYKHDFVLFGYNMDPPR